MYIDESGFESESFRTHGWQKRGKKLHGEKQGCRGVRTSLIAGRCGKRLLAPVLFEGNTNALWFNEWLAHHLLKEIPVNSTIIMDNAAFHKSPETRKILEEADHTLLYLPPYSPDFNPIENDFAIIKKHRQFAKNNNLDNIIKSYGNYLE